MLAVIDPRDMEEPAVSARSASAPLEGNHWYKCSRHWRRSGEQWNLDAKFDATGGDRPLSLRVETGCIA